MGKRMKIEQIDGSKGTVRYTTYVDEKDLSATRAGMRSTMRSKASTSSDVLKVSKA
jgi:hypothetical protein